MCLNCILFKCGLSLYYINTNFRPDSIPSSEERFDPSKNIRIVVKHYYDENGDLIKETNEFRTEKRIVPLQIARRKKLKKFGVASDDPSGGNSANTCVAEHVNMQIIQTKQVIFLLKDFTLYVNILTFIYNIMLILFDIIEIFVYYICKRFVFILL